MILSRHSTMSTPSFYVGVKLGLDKWDQVVKAVRVQDPALASAIVSQVEAILLTNHGMRERYLRSSTRGESHDSNEA